MKLTIFIFCFLLVILRPHGLVSKSITNKEYSSDSENSNEKTDVDRFGSDETAAIHDTYRPRHKYKGVTGHQPRLDRNDLDFDRELDSRNPQCAVMYKNNEPVGILQPFEDSYRFLPVNGEPTLVDLNPIPVKRKTIMDVLYPSKIDDEYKDEIVDNNEQFADDRYPSIFAKFKIDSRLDKNLNPDVSMKRGVYKRKSEKIDLDEDQVDSLKSTLTKMKSDDSEVVEEELKNILDDMGLIDDYPEKEKEKREAEDENLEQGTNKINLIKEEHKEEHKEKREKTDYEISLPTYTTPKKSGPGSTTIAVAKDVPFLEQQTEELESIDLFNNNEEAKLEDSENIDLDTSTDNSIELRKKREEEKNDKVDKDKPKRDLAITNFGDLTTRNSVETAEANEYEKRVEREIRDKIEKLKDEVKKEIDTLKQPDIDKNKKTGLSETNTDTKRRKRQVVNTLMDEETADIDPTLNLDGQMASHVRRKKSVDDFEETQLANNRSQLNKNTEEHDAKNVPRSITTIPKVVIKRFIGVNSVLNDVNHTEYHTRALKQYNIDPNKENMENEPHIRVKREEANKGVTTMPRQPEDQTANITPVLRKKRQTGEEMEDNAYQYDNPQFNEEMPYGHMVNVNKDETNDDSNTDTGPRVVHKVRNSDVSVPYPVLFEIFPVVETIEQLKLDRVEPSRYSSNAKTCNCNKNGNNCKCGKQSVDNTLPTFKDDYEEYDTINSGNSFEKKSTVQTHCNCGKNQNRCKCGRTFDDPQQPIKDEYSDYGDESPNSIEKKEASLNNRAPLNDRVGLDEKGSLNDKESLDDKEAISDYQFDSKLRRKTVVDPDERDRYLPSKQEIHEGEEEYENYDMGENNLAKRETKSKRVARNNPFQNGEYFIDLHPDVYRLSRLDNSREKRENFNGLVAIHGGGPVRSHLVAIKQRSMMPHTRFRRRVQTDDNKELRQLIDMSDEELFGALPQSFEGELARYKRVKRTEAKQ